MKYLSILLTLICSSCFAEDYFFQGSWQTNKTRTKQALDGPISCNFKTSGKEKYSAKFYGIWQGSPYQYDVVFTGPPDKLVGTANVDGTPYTWTGKADTASFTGSFTASNGYVGSFSLKAKKK